MRARLKPLVALCFSVLMTIPAFAADNGNSGGNSGQIEKLSSQTKMLLAQVSSLQQELNSLQENKSHQAKATKKRKKQRQSSASHSANKAHTDVESPNELTSRQIIKLSVEEKEYLPFDLDVPGQAFVSTGPYVGVPLLYSGSNLIINSPSVNIDLQLLNVRKAIHEQLLAMGGALFKEPYHSHLLLSGVVEGQAGYFNPGGAPSTSYIDVTNVSLGFFLIGPSDWLLGYAEMDYDSGPPANNSYTVSNSRVFINKAFITIGNLSESPFYGTIGQIYVPFGVYSSMMVSDPLTKLVARTKARAIELGMQERGEDAFYASIYTFKGDSHAASVSKINNGGVNIGYKFKMPYFHGNFGGGVIGNIADSGGMQLGNGFSQFEQISHRVPAYNLRGTFGLGDHIDIIAELVAATTSFNPNDMSYNGRGAKPWAADLEAGYSFYILDNKPSTIALGYSQSNEALSLGIPLNRTYLTFNTSLWRNTLQAIELRHDRNYAASATANGPTGAAEAPGACTAAACSRSGKGDNAITASFDYYF